MANRTSGQNIRPFTFKMNSQTHDLTGALDGRRLSDAERTRKRDGHGSVGLVLIVEAEAGNEGRSSRMPMLSLT